MKLQLLYLGRNLTRNPLRTVLTCAAVALPIVIFVLSRAVIEGIDRFLDNSTQQLRLVVTQKASIVNPLPAGHRTRIEALDRSRPVSVCGMRWRGGRVPTGSQQLSTIAADADTFPSTYPEYLQQPGELEAWQRDHQAIIVGRGTAQQFGWKVGDRITIQPSVPPYTQMQFHVISTAQGVTDPVTLFCRRDYLEEELKKLRFKENMDSFFFVKCRSPADLEYYRTAIDNLFANSPDETRTEDEKTFMSEYIAQQFDLPPKLAILSAITVFVAVLAAANTMSMNFRDRLSEFAALKSVGFGGRLVCAIIQSESLLVCAVGGLLGGLAPYVAFTHTPLRDYPVPVIQHLDIPPMVCLQALGIALVIGLLAAAWPSWTAVRMKPVDAFRALE